MRIRRLAAAALVLSVIPAVAVVAPASAHGDGCNNVTRRATGGAYGINVNVQVSTVWTNCNTHTHPRSNSITLYFGTGEEETDWKYGSDRVEYSCETKNNGRVASRFSGTLTYGDRVDGYPTVADESQMYYTTDPRTTCTGKIVRDYDGDGTFSMTSHAL